ncbi:MAG: trypsin-like serine protease [Deltaproteobacteria bacterium]|nr:trypsin-like serine protease [Deltaproteobacteria bacterium]
MRLILPVFFVMALSSCGQDPSEPVGQNKQPIINGQLCNEGDHPSAVAIMLDAKAVFTEFNFDMELRTPICTGTLIAPDVVLAAAHCVEAALLTMGMGNVEDETYYVVFTANLMAYSNPMAGLPPEMGGVPLEPLPADARKVKAWIANPAFDVEDLNDFPDGVNDNLNDVALLFLETPVTDVKPAIVITPEETAQLVEDKEVYVVGWGQQVPTVNAFAPPEPGTVGLKVCGPTFINEIGEFEMQIGGGPETTRKCHGDSGGPTYMMVETEFSEKERVVGITSHAYDETDCEKGGADTRVDVWFEWIDEQMRAGCDDGTRSWCEVAGIISPEYYEPKPEADAGVVAGDGAESTTRRSGCGISGESGDRGPTGLAFVLLLAAIFAARRRQR